MTKDSQKDHMMPQSVSIYGKWDNVPSPWMLDEEQRKANSPSSSEPQTQQDVVTQYIDSYD
jgi:hypothetical protein